MPSATSMSSYVDVNLDTSGVASNGGGAAGQKFVTFDDIPDARYETPPPQQPFSAPPVSQQRQQPASGPQFQQDHLSQKQPCLAMEPPKLEQIKKWTITNYRYTKQLVSEKLGHANKTLDQELEDRIGELKVGRVQYQSLLKEARTLQARYDALLSSHRNLRSQFQTLIAHAPELQDQLQACATTQNILEKNGEGLLGAIRTFVDSLNTLVNVTVQDTLLTVKNYENARIEYDAYRNEIDSLQKAPQNEQVKNKLLELQVIFEIRKSKWERLKNDTHTKLNLLNENKSNVMKQQLEMFNSAVVAYFSGNGDKLSEVLSEYHIKTKNASEDDVTSKSFLTRSE